MQLHGSVGSELQRKFGKRLGEREVERIGSRLNQTCPERREGRLQISGRSRCSSPHARERLVWAGPRHTAIPLSPRHPRRIARVHPAQPALLAVIFCGVAGRHEARAAPEPHG